MAIPAKCVLLIDDENVPADFYAKALQRAGFSVRRARSVAEALESLQSNKFVAIVLDIMMPPGKEYQDFDHAEGLRTGVFLLQDIKRLHPKTPIVVLTNVTNQETVNSLRCHSHEPVIAAKIDYPPVEFASLVWTAIGERKE